MKTKRWLLLFTSMLLIFNFACSGNEEEDTPIDSRYPTARNSANGITNSLGEVELDLTSHVVIITVTDTAGSELNNIGVSAYLLKDYLFIFASDTQNEYYPNLKFVPYESLPAKATGEFLSRPTAIQSLEESQAVTVEVTLIVYSVEQDFNPLEANPQYVQYLFSDEWIELNSSSGILIDVYQLADSIAVNGGVFFYLSTSAVNSTQSDYRSSVAAMSLISNYNEFASLMGWVHNIAGTDSVTFDYISYGDLLLPVIYINNVTVNRADFWAQFTLTWGENPQDLDSHLWTPEIGGYSYHIAYYSRGDTNSAPYADLDYDDISSYGPEHITIHQAFPGTYLYAVYHFSGTGTIATSEAQVHIFKPDGNVQSVSVPTGDTLVGSYWWWNVCELNGTTGAVTIINTLSASSPLLSQPMPVKLHGSE